MIRTYGDAPYRIAVIHGGPGAPGCVAPVARELSSDFGVLEPLQTAMSMDGQVEELREQLESSAELPVTLIGASWGAMLSYLFASRYPRFVKKIIMVGSGVYEEKYAVRMMDIRLSRLSADEKAEALALMAELNNSDIPEKDDIMSRFGALIAKTDAFDPDHRFSEGIEVQGELHAKVWGEAAEFRRSCGFLEIGKQVKCPVVAIHGDYDPHPAEGVRVPLSAVLTDFRFITLENCGHEPWIERQARDRFFDILRTELTGLND